MSDLRPGQGADAFSVRMPPGMRERIKAAADQNGRSMNAEIVSTLEERYPPTPIDVRAVDGLLHYVSSATSKVEMIARVAEVNARFTSVGSLLRVDLTPEGKLTIITEF